MLRRNSCSLHFNSRSRLENWEAVACIFWSCACACNPHIQGVQSLFSEWVLQSNLVSPSHPKFVLGNPTKSVVYNFGIPSLVIITPLLMDLVFQAGPRMQLRMSWWMELWSHGFLFGKWSSWWLPDLKNLNPLHLPCIQSTNLVCKRQNVRVFQRSPMPSWEFWQFL